MHAIRSLAAAAALATAAPATSGTLQVDQDNPVVQVRLAPAQGLAIDIGPKHTVSYFLAKGGKCHLSIFVDGIQGGEDVPPMTTVRFDTPLEPGEKGAFATAGHGSLEFACERGATSMSVRQIDNDGHDRLAVQ